MQLLNTISTSNIFAIDIETVRIAENYLDLSDDYQSAWEYKNKQDGKVPSLDELEDLWTRTSALYAEFSKVCAVSVAFMDKNGEKLYVTEIFGDNEIDILNALKTTLDKIDAASNKNRLVGHAAKYFDFPFLCKRYVINGMTIPSILDTAHLKPWESKNLCTNQDIWKMGGTGPGSSLQALCVCLGVPISKVDLVGDEVGSAYYKGEYERIGKYCSLDAVATFNIVRRVKGESIFKEFKKI